MVKTPEEYFEDHLFDVVQTEPTNTFTAAEAAFMSKYLGVNEAEALERLGLHKAVEPECVLSAVGAEYETVADARPVPTVTVSAPAGAVTNATANASEERAVLAEVSRSTEPEVAVAEPVHDASSVTEVVESVEEENAVVYETEPSVLAPDVEEDNWNGTTLDREPDLLEQLRHESELQMVSFFLGKQEFTVPINAVQEVIRYIAPTKLPVAPPFVTGVINLRGIVTPIIQLRGLLGIASLDEQERTDRFIVVCKRHGLQFGLVIDTVHTMYRVPQESIDWAVESHLGVAIQYIFGLMKSEDMLIGIISVDNIVEAILEG
ncbi:chemotaxis protein CheW [Halodesulfovibrio spirochaetisodalis]|uniref:chemotaxis protein CheW n=1 Tax=Halodesulfovibrio spirochaetisodalis TaxID=1560234 RepID=UPI00082EB5ED|nr:chemotaxis protein CheW [Halodesulfovibrio spirochaetisodalis]